MYGVDMDKPGAQEYYNTPIEMAEHFKAHANLWRISGDFWDSGRKFPSLIYER